MIFGRKLSDSLPRFDKRLNVFFNDAVQSEWRQAWAEKESALRTRCKRTIEQLDVGSRPLADLEVGDKVTIQNQSGSHPKKWDRTGYVVEKRNFDQFVI